MTLNLARLFAGEVVKLFHDSQRSDDLALLYVRQAKEKGKQGRPDLVYRCCTDMGCLLFAAYATPRGTIVYHPQTRASDTYVQTRKWNRRLSPVQREGFVSMPERAYVLRATEAVIFVCQHNWGRLSSDNIAEEVRDARLKDERREVRRADTPG